MAVVTAKLPPELSNWLTQEARARRTSKSKIIRQSLELARRGKGAKSRVSFYEANKDLLGVFSGPKDLATNPKYLKGYGK